MEVVFIQSSCFYEPILNKPEFYRENTAQSATQNFRKIHLAEADLFNAVGRKYESDKNGEHSLSATVL
jgi:hypothetical protein